jgi:hypothetical protein
MHMTKPDSSQASDTIEEAKYETEPLERMRLVTAVRTLVLISASDNLEPHRAAHFDGHDLNPSEVD